jgi:hypothetical protein
VPDVALSPKYLNEAGPLEKHNWVRKTYPYADTLNGTIRKLMRQVQRLLDDNPTWSAQQLRAGLNGNSADDFLAYMRLDVERRRTADHPRTAENFSAFTTRYKAFASASRTRRVGEPSPRSLPNCKSSAPPLRFPSVT